jgi:hypothetical protein
MNLSEFIAPQSSFTNSDNPHAAFFGKKPFNSFAKCRNSTAAAMNSRLEQPSLPSPASEEALFVASMRDFLIACKRLFVTFVAYAERETPRLNSIRLKGRRK